MWRGGGRSGEREAVEGTNQSLKESGSGRSDDYLTEKTMIIGVFFRQYLRQQLREGHRQNTPIRQV